MQITISRTREEFAALAEEWNDLLQESAIHVPFLRHEYLFAWWTTLGGGEWTDGDLYILVARDGGKPVGIAPLFLSRDHSGKAALMLLGSYEVSDYLDLIVHPEYLTPFLDALFEYLHSPAAPAWDLLDFYNLLENSPSLPALEEAARRCGWHFNQEILKHCPYIPLPGDWETYLAGIDKKQRHEIRRKIRRAENAEFPIRWYFAQDETRLDAEIDDFLSLMDQDSEKASFLTGPMRAHMRSAIWAAFCAGWLQLAFFEVGGEKAAAYLNFDYGNHIWVYNSGLDYRFSAYSPGWVLLGYLLQWANAHGRVAFDFMRGDEDYKYRFGAVDRRVVRAQVLR